MSNARVEFLCDPPEVARALHETYAELARRHGLAAPAEWLKLSDLERTVLTAAARHVVSERIASIDTDLFESSTPEEENAEEPSEEEGPDEL